jgi:glycosyltransferase involved in cell wall biosynthesis
MDQITAIVVTYNTKKIFQSAYESFRKFHPFMLLIIVDGSSADDPCYKYIDSLPKEYNQVHHLSNIGHGRGMHYGLRQCRTLYALIFDSDIIMLKSPVQKMLELMTSDVYGIGWIYNIGRDGYDFGTPGFNHKDAIPYLHPYFMLINGYQYFKFHRFVHHGAPCYKAMVDLYDKKQSWRLLSFSGLTGHTRGEGINWKAMPNEYIQHDFGGTRRNNLLFGKEEIDGNWE